MLLTINITEKLYEELTPEEKVLIDAAKDATYSSYAPYSNFNVGAALILADGTIVKGANQENAAFSAGTCAERSAIFAAQSQYPEQAVNAIAIAARNGSEPHEPSETIETIEPSETPETPEPPARFTSHPISPCGVCRQAIVELEQRYHQNVKIMMYGEEKTYIVESVKDLLPLTFTEF